MKLFELTNRKALVTGGANGLARGMAEGLLEAGAEVCILDISPRLEDTVASFCEKGYACHGVHADLGDIASLRAGFDAALRALGGRLDILVNAAGIQKRHFAEKFPLEDWNAVLHINLDAVFSLCQMAGQQFIRQQSAGKIINIASMLSFFGGYTVSAYAASKGAVAQLTKALSNEWFAKGINVNAIAPGYMATEMNTALLADEKRNAEILARIPANRWGRPEDLQGVVVFLSSNASDYLGGAIIPVDGGYLCK